MAAWDQARSIRTTEANAFVEGIKAVLEGSSDEFSIEFSRPQGAVARWYSGLVTRFTEVDSIRVVVAHQDITKRKEIEEQWHRSQRSLARAQQIAHLGDFELSADVMAEGRWSDEAC